jgi:hypothetical protein
MKKDNTASPSAAAKAEAVRIQRLREDAQRPISVNLAEGIALSHKLMRFTGAARNSESEPRQPAHKDSSTPLES